MGQRTPDSLMGLDTETSLHELVSLMASFLNIYKDNSALLVTIANLWWMSSGSTSKCFGHYLFDLCNRPMRQELQLILEQHGFKLHRFTKMQVFFNSKYYKTTWLVVDGIFRCWGTVNMCVCVCVCVCSLSCVGLLSTPWTVAHQAPLSMKFSKQEYWSKLPFFL